MSNIEASVANWYTTTLTAAVTASDLTLPVDDLGTLTSPCYIVVDPDNASKREVILADGTFGASSFVASSLAKRGLDGSASGAQAHASGAVVAVAPLAQHLQDIHDRIEAHTHGGSTDGANVPIGSVSGHTAAVHTGLGLLDEAAHDALDHSALTGVPVVSAVVKSADESVTSSTTLQDDNDLVLALAANTTYLIELFLYADFVSADTIKVAFSIPAGATIAFHRVDSGAVGEASNDYIGMSFGTNDPEAASFRGFVTIGGTAGNLQLRWAQLVSNATAATVKAGSWLRAEKVA